MRLYTIGFLAALVLAGCGESTTSTATTNDSGSSSSTGSDNDSGSTDTGNNNDADSSQGSDQDTSGGATAGSDQGTSGGAASGSNETGGTTATCTPTDVGIAFQSVNATVVSDPDAAPAELIDGCVDREHSWSGDTGSIVTLDAGAVHQMQGVYIWSTFARMEWIKIESSADGLRWNTDWYAVPTKPVAGPVYYSLAETGATRFVRVTGFGSDVNTWSNLTEMRWSLSGYHVSGERVWQHKTEYKPEYTGFYTYSIENPLTAVSSSHARVMWIRTGKYCDRIRRNHKLIVVDVTGTLNKYYDYQNVADAHVYRVDWDHWDGEVNELTGPQQVWDISDDFYSRVAPLPIGNEEPGCPGAGSGDPEYNVGASYSNIVHNSGSNTTLSGFH